MSEHTAISWTDHTWNPWQGCTKVSPGCANCYMFREKRRFKQDPTVVRRSADATYRLPLKLEANVINTPSHGKYVFVCSWSDFFHSGADQWRDDAWGIIRQCPHLVFQILTKRAERIEQCLPSDWGSGYPNVWLGVSVESYAFRYRSDTLQVIPAAVRFISYEPALGPLAGIDLSGIDWLIYGGESGPDFRPDNDQWCRDIRRECFISDTAFYRKQGAGRRPGMHVKLDGEIIQETPDNE